MTLLIACLIIYTQHLHWAFYIVAFCVWVGHHNESTNKHISRLGDRINNRLNGLQERLKKIEDRK